MFDVRTTGDTAHIDTIFKFLPHTRQQGASLFLTASCRNVNYDEKQLTGGKKLSCSFYLYRFRKYVSYGFPIINVCNLGVHYETPCICIVPYETPCTMMTRTDGEEIYIESYIFK
jgi:hypothetical protein